MKTTYSFALSNSYQLSLILAVALGIASQFYMTIISAILQVNLPNELRGRVMGIYGLTWELMPVGGMIAGAIAEFAGAPMAVGFGGFMVAGMAIAVAIFLHHRRLYRISLVTPEARVNGNGRKKPRNGRRATRKLRVLPASSRRSLTAAPPTLSSELTTR